MSLSKKSSVLIISLGLAFCSIGHADNSGKDKEHRGFWRHGHPGYHSPHKSGGTEQGNPPSSNSNKQVTPPTPKGK